MGDATEDADVAEADAPDAAMEGGLGEACHELIAAGKSVVPSFLAGAPPTLGGGDLVAGTYVLRGVVIYGPTAPSATSLKETLVLGDGTYRVVLVQESDPTQRSIGSYALAGTKITLSASCPKVGPLTYDFEVTGTTLQLLHRGSTWSFLFVFDLT